ncbi:MAG: hypothetical protein ACK6DC_05495, partial [Planctomycetota bacterium]
FWVVHGGPRREGGPSGGAVVFVAVVFVAASGGIGAATGRPGGTDRSADALTGAPVSTIGNFTIPSAGSNKASALAAQIKIKPVNFILASGESFSANLSVSDSKFAPCEEDQWVKRSLRGGRSPCKIQRSG